MSAYRPDIDGLRALAVLSVLLYHLKAPVISGGYVGVDIFFVISGFLITRNIWNELEAGTFTVRGFYLRRIRRIAPAFVVMATITLVLGCLLLLPEDLRRLGASTTAAALSASNVYFAFALDTGYFADTSDQEPMLHTWSLGVEEQFYLIWPAALLALTYLVGRQGRVRLPRWSGRSWAILATGAVLVTSFAIGEALVGRYPTLAYFMLPARAGELMIGALLAFALRRDADVDALVGRLGPRWAPALAEGTAVLGLVLVGWSLTQLDDASSFPGLNALWPGLGAGLLILAGGLGSRVTGGLLGWGPIVFVGLISYSLYLWHWPVLAFIRYFYGELSATQVAIAVPVIFTLAVASYLWVELPARSWRPRPRVQVARLFVAPTIGILLGSAVILSSDGLNSLIAGSPTFSDKLASLVSRVEPASAFDYNCQQPHLEPGILDASRCLIGSATAIVAGEPDVLLWGDSHAGAAIGVLGGLAEASGNAFRNASFSRCPPFFGGQWSAADVRAECRRFRDQVQRAIANGRYRTVILGGVWLGYDRDPRFRPTIEATVEEITAEGVHVVILGQAPQFPGYQRQCPARALRVPVDCVALATIPDNGDTSADHFLRELAKRTPNTTFLSLREQICNSGTCSPYLDGEPIYFNVGHLSVDGSWRVGRHLAAGPNAQSWLEAVWGTGTAKG